MEKLNVEQQAEVKKTSTERLRVLLVKAEEDVAGLERADVVRLYAEYIAFTPLQTATADTAPDAATADAEATGGTGIKDEVLDELVLRQKELELRQQE